MHPIPRHSSILPLLLLCVVWTTGCASHGKKNKAKPAAVGQETNFYGTIALVNEESRFVLIEAGYNTAPADGTLLKSFRGETESADLSVSPERRRPFVIADIVRGTPQKGDRVVFSKPASPTAPDQAPAGASGVVQ
ncbi:MAG: hypothetical protein JWL59_1544 [Chthoniobacteraceae bacterium]|nr:hypothetical protein [Chthoniobacteraceae bacterium]